MAQDRPPRERTAWTGLVYLQTGTPQEDKPRWVLSWRSFVVYYHLFILFVFLVICGSHLTSTLFLAADDSLDISKKVVNLPWFASAALPVASSVFILARARSVTKMIRSWEKLGFNIHYKLGHRADPRYARSVLAAYIAMTLGSLGLFVHQRVFGASPGPNLGFRFPEPWSRVADITMHSCVVGTWAGYLVPEALLLVAAHHLAGHYRAVNTYFTQVLDRLAGDKKVSAGRSYTTKGRLEVAREELQQVWELYGEVDQTLDNANRVFAPINLINFTMYMLLICGLLVPPMKSHDVLGTSGMVGNAVLAMLRLVILILGQAKVNEELTAGCLLVSRRHTRLVTGGLHVPEVAALLGQLKSGSGRGISAWGFFVVKKGTLLTFFSFLMSYVVIMLQS